MRTLIPVLFILAIGCKQPGNKTNTEEPSGRMSIETANPLIPKKITDYIAENLPGWSVPDTLDYVEGWCFFFNRGTGQYFKDQIPFFATANLNDDNYPDYALLLQDSVTLRLVLLENTGNSLKHHIAEDFNAVYTEKGIRHGLYIEPPRQIDCIVNNVDKSLILKTNGVALMEMEEMIKVYYWDNGKFNVFDMKDI